MPGYRPQVDSDRTPSARDLSASDSGEVFATYRPDNAVIADARDAFSTWLADTAPGSTVGNDMLVVLSELLANAFAATLDDRSDVAVHAWVEGDLMLEVANPADAEFDPGAHWDYDDPLRPGGRGLVIVESLVDDLAITPPHGDFPLRVRCQRAL